MIITGIQPTGSLHLGNYLGAIKPLLALQKTDPDTYVFIADYHAITAGFDPSTLQRDSFRLAAMLIAAGFNTDLDAGCIFFQSDVPEHVEMAHILGCTASRFGQLSRMIQFKEKMEALGENAESPSVGLFTYPVLQAADILLYQDRDNFTATKVPVGEDQSQHLNLCVDIAQSFNHRFGKTFIVPEPMISPTPRIMSLTDGQKKMSKSDPSDLSRINMDDTPDQIVKKFRKATSDAAFVPFTVEEIGERNELRNLLTIYAAFAELTMQEAVDNFAGKGFGPLKTALADIVIAHLEPVQARYAELIDVPESMGLYDSTVGKALGRGANSASVLAGESMHHVRRAIGIRS